MGELRGVDGVAVVQAMPLPALLITDGIVTAVNSGATTLLQVDAESIGTPLREVRLARRIPGLNDAVVLAARGTRAPALDVKALSTARGIRRLRLTAYPVAAGTADRHAVLLVAEDVSSAGDADPARLRQEPESRFLAMVAHELRNPLGTILHALHVIGQRLRGDVPAERARVIAERQVLHQARLLEDLLDVGRLRAGKLDIRPERVDLAGVVRDAVDSMRMGVEARAQEMVLTVASPHLAIRGDRTRLEQVVRNLLDNARKFTGPGGRIDAWVGHEGSDAVIRVTDTGEGIDPDMLPQIFEPFAQLRTSIATSRGGLGLGLALVRGLVEQHGGGVTATSAGRGLGTTFEVRLPPDHAPAPARHTTDAHGATLRRRRVLVVEDDRDARELLRAVLELDGHTVDAAANGADGVRRAAASAPDVVLIDIGLPEIDGYEVARRIRRRLGAAVRLVALTGYGDAEAQRRARDAGFDLHVVKPVIHDDLSRALTGS
jgi:signal transduction histidine kinase